MRGKRIFKRGIAPLKLPDLRDKESLRKAKPLLSNEFPLSIDMDIFISLE